MEIEIKPWPPERGRKRILVDGIRCASDRWLARGGRRRCAVSQVQRRCGAIISGVTVMDNYTQVRPRAKGHSGVGLVVICGSMAHFSMMVELQGQLRSYGIDSVAPQDERRYVERSLSERDLVRMKRQMSEKYFRIIRGRAVYGILVANFEKHARRNYIGPNTLAEIAIAFNAKKKIYLLHDIFADLRDELLAWDAVSLRGDLSLLVRDLANDNLLWTMGTPFKHRNRAEIRGARRGGDHGRQRARPGGVAR